MNLAEFNERWLRDPDFPQAVQHMSMPDLARLVDEASAEFKGPDPLRGMMPRELLFYTYMRRLEAWLLAFEPPKANGKKRKDA
jgi:hypothetical protein